MRLDGNASGSPTREQILETLRTFPEGIRKMLRAALDRPDFPLRVTEIADGMRRHARDKQRKWQDLAILGRSLAPDDPEVCSNSDWALRKKIPRWHFPMLRDEKRNRAFQDALEKQVDGSTVVLEIGTGSGILAMMAARAGARHVYSCEAEGLIAEAARENIRRNGYRDRVTVIAGKSTDLTVGVDLPEKADLLVAEIFDSRLLGEHVLPYVEDAKRRLLRPGAAVLPSGIAALGVLVGDDAWTGNCRVGRVSGFDLSAMNRFATSETPVPSDRDLEDAFCDPVELFAFDLAHGDDFPPESKTLRVTITRDGRVDGFLKWIRLGFDRTLVYQNRPPQRSAWLPMLHLFPEPIEVRQGDRLLLSLSHDREHVHVGPVKMWPSPTR